jgi:hypothetical protein
MRARAADHLEALSLEIERKLQKALNSNSQRLQLLQQLFADIALKVDDRARGAISFIASDVNQTNAFSSCVYLWTVIMRLAPSLW